MKLPKKFGGQGFAGALAEAQQAMAKAKNLEAELEAQRMEITRGPVRCLFSGTGEMLAIKIHPEGVDLEDLETLEDVITACVREGFATATELRANRIAEIMPNLPGGLGNLGL
jgi:DNA-binding YbaB/EbfC family protein